uniref:Pentacotripeptide-repeat region of PRORP domain-containing protein n=1 Tax=Oryza punctata TaxID=4537 RepID=A0A0E0MIS5_ORYPU
MEPQEQHQDYEEQKKHKHKEKRKKERFLDFLRAAPSKAPWFSFLTRLSSLRTTNNPAASRRLPAFVRSVDWRTLRTKRLLLAGVAPSNHLPPLTVKLLHARLLRLDLLAGLSPLLLRALSSSALHLHALRLHCLLPSPSHLTFPIALKSASRLPDPLRAGEQLHARSLKLPSHTNPHVLTSLLNLYAKCGLLHPAQRVFDEIPHPSTVSWTALITAYMDAGDLREAIHVARNAFANGMRPDSFTAVRVLGLRIWQLGRHFGGLPSRRGFHRACS